MKNPFTTGKRKFLPVFSGIVLGLMMVLGSIMQVGAVTTTDPHVNLNGTTNITATTATLNATVNPGNGSTTVTFYWDTDWHWGDYNDFAHHATATQSPVSGGSDVSVSLPITGLPAHSGIYVIVRVVNSHDHDSDSGWFETLHSITNTTTTLSRDSGSGSVTYGTSVSYTAHVDPHPGADGAVWFYVDSVDVAHVSLNSSSNAQFSTSTHLSVAGSPHSIYAVYQGDSDHDEYAPSTSNTLTLSTTAKALTITGVTAGNKTYDGTLTATITGTPTLVGVVSGDTVGVNIGSAQFVSKNVGTGIVVNFSGFTLNGADAGNYTVSQPGPTTANITARHITVYAGASSKVYDGNTTSTTIPTVGATPSSTPTPPTGLASGDIGVWTETYDNKNVGTTHVMTPSGTIHDGSLVDMTGNYTITFITFDTGVINAKPITVTANAQIKTMTFPDPVLTYTVVPALISGDSFTGNLIRDPGEIPGYYNISQGTLSAGLNYSITFVGNRLEIRSVFTEVGPTTVAPNATTVPAVPTTTTTPPTTTTTPPTTTTTPPTTTTTPPTTTTTPPTTTTTPPTTTTTPPTTTTAPPITTTASGSGTGTGVIVGTGGGVLVVLLGGLLFLFWRRNKKNKKDNK